MTQPPYPPEQQPPYLPMPTGQTPVPWQQQPAPVYQPAYVAVPPPMPMPTSGAAVASLVLGILALLLCWMPFVGVIAWPLLIIGGVLGFVGLSSTRSGTASGHGVAVGGLVCNGIALAVCLLYLIPFLIFGIAGASAAASAGH